MRLDVVSTTLQVEILWLQNVVIDDFDFDEFPWQVFDELAQFGASNTVCAIYCDGTVRLAMLHRLLEGGRELLVVSILADIPIRVLCSLGIHATDEIMQLWCREEFVVGVFGTGGLERIHKARNKSSTGCACIAGVDDARGSIGVDLEVGLKFLVEMDQVLVRRRIG